MYFVYLYIPGVFSSARCVLDLPLKLALLQPAVVPSNNPCVVRLCLPSTHDFWTCSTNTSRLFYVLFSRVSKAIGNCFERANLPNVSDEQRVSALTFAIVGAGPTAVECCAELRDFIEEVSSDRNIAWYRPCSHSTVPVYSRVEW